MSKAVIYARVSSREQEREGYSIPAQIQLLQEYTKKHKLNVLKIFEEAETAKEIGRKQFNEMLLFVEESKDKIIILVEKTDRLYRNFSDRVRIEELGCEVHLVKEGEIISKESKSHTKLVHDFKLLLAKNYIDNLSEEVKKGQSQKAEQGHWPLVAPMGYINNKETRLIDIDKNEAPFVRRAFELYASGEYSLSQTREKLYEEGFIYKNYQNKISKSALDKLLKNPFYTGDFIFRGKFYKGKHKPIVSVELFEQVQKVFKNVARAKGVKHNFAFSGLLTCGRCGCMVTGQIQKQKYVYYHCSNGKGKCDDKYVREEDISKQISEAVKRLSVNNEQLDWIIPEELWFRKHEQYKEEIRLIEKYIEQHTNANFDYIESGIQLLNLAKNAYSLYSSQSDIEKRRVLKLLLSNCTLNAGIVHYEYNMPFSLMLKIPEKEKISG
jgi:site-specific DNA recombinase